MGGRVERFVEVGVYLCTVPSGFVWASWFFVFHMA